jgi:hypothetical protein
MESFSEQLIYHQASLAFLACNSSSVVRFGSERVRSYILTLSLVLARLLYYPLTGSLLPYKQPL